MLILNLLLLLEVNRNRNLQNNPSCQSMLSYNGCMRALPVVRMFHQILKIIVGNPRKVHTISPNCHCYLLARHFSFVKSLNNIKQNFPTEMDTERTCWSYFYMCGHKHDELPIKEDWNLAIIHHFSVASRAWQKLTDFMCKVAWLPNVEILAILNSALQRNQML